MAQRIRRDSMEHLQLYDLDKVTLNGEKPPPLPPPRHHRRHLPANFAFERYKFLCDMKRHKTDPVYAATPMFTTIPQGTQEKHPRQVLGSYVPSNIIKPIKHVTPDSADTKSDDETEEEEEEKDDESSEEEEEEDNNQSSANDDNDDHDDDADDNDDQSSSSSSTDDDDDNDDDDILKDDDDDDKGIVEQIFNRDEK